MNTTQIALAAAMFAGCSAANAAITCSSVTSPGFTLYYNSAGSTLAQGSFTVTCSRALATDAASVNYDVNADNGANAGGGFNGAILGPAKILYDVYKDSSCTSAARWKTGGGRISGTITWGATLGALSQTQYFWACAPNGQTGKPVGTYLDTITMTLTGGSGPNITGSVPVSIQSPALCTVTSPPAALTFDYIAFGAAVNPATTFFVNCNSGMAYSLALSTASGTLIGLDYTLSVNTAQQTGSGVAQMQSINGAMAAGQAGICATGTCSATQAHSLTITY